ncbi:MAG: hypothetical protein Q8M02_05810 [Candidatus Didemnitutus sp.]|nr:hypothetical protein [Candidatus Didemnitutus sp.]
MHTRLLSFLSDIENSLAADDPSPDDGAWETTRTVNYHLGLARLNLGVRTAAGATPRGTVLLQGYELADGTACLKATLSWCSSENRLIRPIFTRPNVNWTSEARKIAAEWMAGPPASTGSTVEHENEKLFATA